MLSHATTLIALLGALVCLASSAVAQTDDAPEIDASAAAGGTVLAGPTAELDAHLIALELALKEQEPRSRTYFAGWVSVLGLLTGGQAVLAALEDEDKGKRASSIMGSAFSGVGLALVLVAPSPGRHGYRKFRALPAGTPEEKAQKLKLGEEYLDGEAAAVRRTHAWYTHAIGAALGVGGFLGLYLGYDDNLENALRTGLGTIVITELRVWTRTKRAIRKADAYHGTTPAQVFVTPLIAPSAQGLVAVGLF